LDIGGFEHLERDNVSRLLLLIKVLPGKAEIGIRLIEVVVVEIYNASSQ
jgi:hypothetical protein